MKTTTIGIDLAKNNFRFGGDHVCVLEGEAYAARSQIPPEGFGIVVDH